MRHTEQFTLTDVASWGPFTVDHTFNDESVNRAWIAFESNQRGPGHRVVPKDYALVFKRVEDPAATPIEEGTHRPSSMILEVSFTVTVPPGDNYADPLVGNKDDRLGAPPLRAHPVAGE